MVPLSTAMITMPGGADCGPRSVKLSSIAAFWSGCSTPKAYTRIAASSATAATLASRIHRGASGVENHERIVPTGARDWGLAGALHRVRLAGSRT